MTVRVLELVVLIKQCARRGILKETTRVFLTGIEKRKGSREERGSWRVFRNQEPAGLCTLSSQVRAGESGPWSICVAAADIDTEAILRLNYVTGPLYGVEAGR